MVHTTQRQKYIRYKTDKNLTETQKVLGEDPIFKVGENVKSTYDAWGWVFQEIYNLRLEVSRLAVLVRINNENSPKLLTPYHAHLYSLLLPCSVIIPDATWDKIDKLWLKTGEEIEEYNAIRRTFKNKKIPQQLIRRLDIIHRVSLLAAQWAGLGIRTEYTTDMNTAIENTIVGG